jgi:mRNA interferase RelE/StbE
MSNAVVVIYSRAALKFLKKLDSDTATRIYNKIEENAQQSNPLVRAIALQGELSGKYRYRIGDYRAIFTIDNDKQVILLSVSVIKHRKDIYRK